MEIDLAVLADAANVTVEGKINIIGVFRNFLAPTLPVTIPLFYIAVTLTLTEVELGGSHQLEIHFRNANQEITTQVGTSVFMVQPQKDYNYPMINLLTRVANLQVAEYGLYFFELIIDGAIIKTIPFFVSHSFNMQQNLLT